MQSDNHFIPYGRQTISDDDVQAVINALRSPYLTQGPTVPAFEQAIASKVGAKYGVAVNSATSALHLACMALEVGPGDLVWTSPITFVASANCGRYCGADVNFVDIDPKTGLMSVKALEEKLKTAENQGKLPKVVIPVHLSGTSCDMKRIAELAQKYDFKIIEDASHAIGGWHEGKPVGSCIYSEITVFSFHPVKIITTGEGGIATTNKKQLVHNMAELRSHGITKDPESFEHPAAGPWSYEQQKLGYNYRMTDLQAALGLSQLQKLEEIVIERNKQLDRYRYLMESLPLEFLEIPEGSLSSVHLAVIRLSDNSPMHHLRVFSRLKECGIGVQVHYSPVHLQPYYRKRGFKEGDFPEAEKYGCNAISLPLFPGLSTKDQDRVVEAITNILNSEPSQ